MRYELECNVRSCRRRVWCPGTTQTGGDYDEVFIFIPVDTIPETACIHIIVGSYTIIDEEEENDE